MIRTRNKIRVSGALGILALGLVFIAPSYAQSTKVFDIPGGNTPKTADPNSGNNTTDGILNSEQYRQFLQKKWGDKWSNHFSEERELEAYVKELNQKENQNKQRERQLTWYELLGNFAAKYPISTGAVSGLLLLGAAAFQFDWLSKLKKNKQGRQLNASGLNTDILAEYSETKPKGFWSKVEGLFVSTAYAPAVTPQGLRDLTKNYKIEGDYAFKNQVTLSLVKMYNTPSGKKLLEVIHNTGKTVTIKHTSDLNGYEMQTDRSIAASVKATKKGVPVWAVQPDPKDPKKEIYWVVYQAGTDKPVLGEGVGTDSTVIWNDKFESRNHLDKKKPKPADSTLFHELTHTARTTTGTAEVAEVTGDLIDYDNIEEYKAISGGSELGIPSENDYLKDINYGYVRIDHHGGYAKAN